MSKYIRIFELKDLFGTQLRYLQAAVVLNASFSINPASCEVERCDFGSTEEIKRTLIGQLVENNALKSLIFKGKYVIGA